MNILIALLFVANAVAHVVSYRQLADRAAPGQGGVLAFAGIRPALIFPTLGGLGLTANTILPRKGTSIDFTILGLDISTVVLVIFGLIA